MSATAPLAHGLALVCVVLISTGQILFKFAAQSWRAAGTLADARTAGFVLAALALYGGATILWIWLLQHAPLGRLYPYMALSFVFVAAAGALLFGEPIAARYWAGLGLIVTGVLVIAAA